jgi:hypothetical protein
MTKVDLGLTIVGGFDLADSVISVNDINLRSWGVTASCGLTVVGAGEEQA